ncbi:MAG: hypothetical protein AAFU79_31525, partial [Myxococcota bacterium]
MPTEPTAAVGMALASPSLRISAPLTHALAMVRVLEARGLFARSQLERAGLGGTVSVRSTASSREPAEVQTSTVISGDTLARLRDAL